MTTNIPFVLHVDDEPGDLRPWQDEVVAQGHFDLEVCHPNDVSEASLKRAALVLVDFKIQHWAERANAPALALRPTNGLAVLAVLQEAAFDLGPMKARAFALYTAVIQDVARELVHQPHIVARAHNLEWVFEKNGADNPPAERVRRVASLAKAVTALPTKWPGDDSGTAAAALHTWLGLQRDVPWFDAAWRAVRRCRPPIHEFAEHTQGTGVVRWALHRVLPYPTFLISAAHLAARLRVSLESLRTAVASEEFDKVFGAVEYRGALGSFLGRRWWRAGVEHVIYEATTDSPGDLGVLHAALKEGIPSLACESAARLFPVLGRQFRTKDALAVERDVVEVRPDDWPPFADEAWALRTDLEDAAELKAVAVDEDA